MHRFRIDGVPICLLSLDSSLFPGSFKLLIPLFENHLVSACQFVCRGDEADRAMEPDSVVMRDVLCHKSPGIVKGKRRFGSDAFSFERFVKAFQLAVRLRIIRRRSYVRHARQPDEFFEVLGNELRTVVRDNPWTSLRKLLFGPLDDDFNVRFQHPLPDLPVDDEAAATVHDAAEVIKLAADVQIRDIYMPVFVRLKRLNESGALLAGFLVPLLQEPRF